MKLGAPRAHASTASPARDRLGRLFTSAALVACVAAPRAASATGDPDLTWWTYETEHFKVTYPDTLEPIAKRVAELAETIHVRVSSRMAFEPEEKTELVITDDSDQANGVASPVPYDNIRLFATAPPDISTLGDYDDWLLGLVTHEYTHILHTGNISGLASIANVVIGRTLSPNSAQPRWILEGLAVVEESEHTTGGRIRSNLFDMWLRADVVEDNFARFDQISSGAQRWPYGNFFYLYGSRFLRWISDVYGPDTMPAVAADYGATTIPFGINRAIRRVTGVTYEDLYDGWHAQLVTHYKEQLDAVDARGRIEGKRITEHGHSVLYPRFVPGGAPDELVYFRDDFNGVPGLYGLRVGDPSTAGPRDEALVARTATESSPAFTPDGDLVFEDLAPFKNVYSRVDLFSMKRGARAPTGTEDEKKQLTFGLRAEGADVSPNGRDIVFSVNDASTRTLEIARLSDTGEIESRRVLVPSERFEQVYTPRFSPDGKKVAYSVWSTGGYRDIRIVDVASGAFEPITHDRALDMQPVWSPDGSMLYFSSDRSGIFNVYAYDLTSGALAMVTNVHNGALTPAISSDGKTLVYTGYTHDGYDLFAMPLEPAKFLPAPAAPDDRPSPLPEPGRVKLERYRYNPLPTLRPRNYVLSVGTGNYGDVSFTLKTSGGDLLGQHSISAALTVEPSAPEPRFNLDYAYGALPVNLGTGFSRSVVPRKNGYRVAGKTIPFDETLTGGYLSVGLPIRSTYVDQSFGLTYSFQNSSAKLELPEKLDPQSTRTLLPPEGILAQMRATYSISTIQGGVDTAGSSRGASLRLDTSYAGEETGSAYTYYAFGASVVGYIPMPWPGNHTIAARASGAFSGGTYARRGSYFVGGYDLENVSILDQALEGTYSGAFVLRGYAPGEYSGSQFLMTTLEYRAPLWRPNWGPSSLPIFFRRMDLAAFVDYGGAFDDLRIEDAELGVRGDLIRLVTMHCSVGAELWTNFTVANRVDLALRFGYAYGFSSLDFPDGQPYFLIASSF
ncbi:MAG: hypothetical protein U0414_07725 [Polyangiaceae bacterium]